MPETMLPKSHVYAKRVPYEVRSLEELEGWVRVQRLALGAVNDVPNAWHEGLSKTPGGYVALSNNHCGRLVLCAGEDDVKVVDFSEPLPTGQMVFLVPEPEFATA